jgi:hypothetical protein
LCSLFNWTVNNRLSLNASKTTALLITNRLRDISTPLTLKIADVNVDFADDFKFLGVYLDSNLRFSNHIQHICLKLAKTSGILYRISKLVPQNLLINLYYSLVYPYLIYGILIWGNASENNLSPLIILQKKIVRTITNSDFLAHTSPLFYQTKILRVKDVYRLNLGIHMYKEHSSNNISYPLHCYNTRTRNNASVRFQRLAQCQRSLSFNGPQCWNSIPIDIRMSTSLSIFKKRFKEHLLAGYVVS